MEEEIRAAQAALAGQGLFVEPTGALSMAAWPRAVQDTDRAVVLMLTGSGLKTQQ
jgi:threonine synthase